MRPHPRFWPPGSGFVIIGMRSGTGLYPRSHCGHQRWSREWHRRPPMSVVPNAGDGKVTVPALLQRKSAADSPSQKIICLTAYDYPTARLLDEAGVDVILVGDSLGMVALGYDTTLPVTLDEMIHHTRAVRRATRRALVVADMPYGSYHTDTAESLRNAVRFVKEAGAEAVKVEGGERRLELIARLTEAEIPVM